MSGVKEVHLFYVTSEPGVYYAEKLAAESAARRAGKGYESVFYKRFYTEADMPVGMKEPKNETR